MSTAITIKLYFEEQKQDYGDRLHAALEEEARLHNQIEAIESERDDVAADIARKNALIEKNRAEGVDTDALATQIEDLERQRSQMAESCRSLEEQAQAKKPTRPFDFQRAELLAGVLEQHDCTDAVEVHGLHEFIPHLRVGDEIVTGGSSSGAEALSHGRMGIVVDRAGRPIWCSVGLSRQDVFPIQVRPSDNHFAIGHRPELLNWLPAQAESESAAQADEVELPDADVGAFIDRDASVLALTRTEFHYRRAIPQNDWGVAKRKTEYEHKHDDFADIATSLPEYLAELVNTAGGSLDLDADYPDNPLMAHVKSLLTRITTSEPAFRPCTERLRSGEIEKRIKADWDAFVRAPWSGSIRGSLAVAKHLLESGERPRFWNAGFEGTYGVRIRTRDHDWLVATVYIPASGSPGESGMPIDVHTGGDASAYDAHEMACIASHGRMAILIQRSKQ